MENFVNGNEENFKELISSPKLTIVDFWADWCGPCKKVAPILEEISQEFGLTVAKLDVDANPIMAGEYKVVSIPTMILFENGIPMKTIIGAKPKHLMLKELEEWL